MRAAAVCVLAWLFAAGCGGSFRAHAADAQPFRVPVAMKAQLQVLLDRHGTIRLDANADYRSGGKVLTVSSGQRIVGGWNTRVPRIVIPGGVSGVEIDDVRSDGWTAPDVEFTGGAPNDDIRVVGGSGGPGTQIRVRIRNGARINRLSLTEFGGLEVQQASSGYVRDSTFTALLGYWPGPHVAWDGNLAEPSRGNSFLGIASITPGRTSVWRNAGDLRLVGWDCESWNGADGRSPRCFSIEDATKVVSVSLQGGTAYPQAGGALASFSGVPALVSWFQRGRGGNLDGADVLLRDVGALLTVQAAEYTRVRDSDIPSGGLRLRLLEAALDRGGAQIAPSDAAALTPAQRATVASAFAGPYVASSPAKPARRVIADALGPAWRTGLASRPDSAARIQADIDAHGIASLAAGTYYLDKPLKIGNRKRIEGVLGVDRERVYLVAKGDFPVIEGRGDFGRGKLPNGSDDGAVIGLVLGGLTIYGGTYGVHWSGEVGNLGPGGTVSWSEFADLKFMHQSAAGVNVVGINGIDSNVWHRVDFVDMPVAFRGVGSGAGAGMSYADKQHFIDCQYQDVADTVWYWTTDRASGGAVWKDNVYFNVGHLTKTRAANNLLWVNSVMENVTGDVAIDVTDGASTATYYFTMIDGLWRGQGPAVVTDTQSWGIGTLFIDTEFAQTGGSIVAPSGGQSLFAWRSRITGSATVGAVQSGVFVDSELGSFDQALQVVEDGRAITLASGR